MYTENRFDFTSQEDAAIIELILIPLDYELKEGSDDLIQQVFMSHFSKRTDMPFRHPLQIARRCRELIAADVRETRVRAVEPKNELSAFKPAVQSHPKHQYSASFTEEQDQMLLHLVNSQLSNNTIHWVEIANNFPGKAPTACRYRYERFLKFKDKDAQKGLKWAVKEDALLLLLVQKFYGVKNWKKVSQAFNKVRSTLGLDDECFRDQFSCRERYMNVLNPTVDLEAARKPFTDDENHKLVEAGRQMQLQGGKVSWSKISAECFEGQRSAFKCRRQWMLLHSIPQNKPQGKRSRPRKRSNKRRVK